jgi:hypothetical protein
VGASSTFSVSSLQEKVKISKNPKSNRVAFFIRTSFMH